MAAPAMPQNVYLQQGNANAYVSWDIVGSATSYDVQRSTDGVTFSTVGSPVVNSFLDTTVTVNTQYWYQVGAVNGDGTSPYAIPTPESVVPTLSGKISLGELRLRSQEKADRVNSQFVILPEWNFFINQAYYELYDILITVYEDYYVAPRLMLTTVSNQNMYDLPNGQNNSGAPAFYKLFGVDLGLDSTTNAFVTLKKFDFISRNQYVYPQISSTLLGVFNLKYRIIGDKLMVIPSPSGGQPLGLWYFPRLTTLLSDTDVMDGISGWEAYVIARAAKYALDKEESDTSKLDQELLYLKGRIEETAMNRDAGQPDTISNVRTRADQWGWGVFGGPFGGY